MSPNSLQIVLKSYGHDHSSCENVRTRQGDQEIIWDGHQRFMFVDGKDDEKIGNNTHCDEDTHDRDEQGAFQRWEFYPTQIKWPAFRIISEGYVL